MKTVVVFLTMTALTVAKPNGYYHQEYNYQASSASYKNNELQRRNDDQGFYSQHGDLEGRVQPRVNSHSQHSEYINPKLKQGYTMMAPDRSASFGQLYAENQFRQPPYNPDMEYAASYGVHQQQQQVNLRQICMQLQQELEREMQRAVYDHYRRSSAYTNVVSQAQAEADMRLLQEELRRNMTMRLEESLKRHFGHQGVRGGYAYTILDGRLQPVANYNNQELMELTRQMEEHLMRQLQQYVQSYYHTTVNTEVHTTRNTYRRVPSPMMERPMVYHPYPQQIQIPTHIPDSLTTVASRVQTELNEHLNRILEYTQKQFFSTNNYVHQPGVNYDALLAQLQEELRANITLFFDDQIKRTYGYNSKYSLEDIENLRRQIETNLMTKLNRDFIRQREDFFQRQAAASNRIYETRPIPGNMYYHPHPPPPPPPPNNYQNQAELETMHRQMRESLSRQLQQALMEQSYRQAHMYTGGNFNPQVNYQATLDQLTAELNRNLTRQMEQFYSGRNYQGAYAVQLANLRNQLQEELMHQLHQGLQQSFSRYSTWSAASSSHSAHSANFRPVRGSEPGFHVVGDDCMMGDDPSAYRHTRKTRSLDEENLTQQIQSQDDLSQELEDQDLTQQVQSHNDLTQQVQSHDDLTQQVQNHDDLTQQVQSQDLTQQLEDQDLTQQVQSHDDLTQQLEDQDLTQQVQSHDDLTQQVQSQDLTQQLEDQDLTQQVQSHNDLTQQHQDQDLTQQVQEPDQVRPSSNQNVLTLTQVPTYGRDQTYRRRYYQQQYSSPDASYTSTYTWQPQSRPQNPPQNQEGIVRQRVEQFENYNKPPQLPQNTQQYHQVPSPVRPGYRQKPWSQQTQGTSFPKPQFQQQLGQQTEDVGFGKLEQLGQSQDEDLIQQTQDPGFPQSQSQQLQQNQLGQQTEDVGFGKLEQQTQDQNQQQLGQQSDLTQVQQPDLGNQQSQDIILGQSQHPLGRQNQQPLGQQSDLTQQPERPQQSQDIILGQSQYPLGRQNQQQGDLTQQSQRLDFGNQQAEDDILRQQAQYPVGLQVIPIPPRSNNLYTAQNPLGQQTRDQNQQQLEQQNDVTQQAQHPGFGNLQSQQTQQQLGQETDENVLERQSYPQRIPPQSADQLHPLQDPLGQPTQQLGQVPYPGSSSSINPAYPERPISQVDPGFSRTPWRPSYTNDPGFSYQPWRPPPHYNDPGFSIPPGHQYRQYTPLWTQQTPASPDLTQQGQIIPGIEPDNQGRPNYPNQQGQILTQQTEDQLGQRTDDDEFETLQKSQNQDQSLTQQTQDQLGQRTDDDVFEKLQKPQNEDRSLTQQTQDLLGHESSDQQRSQDQRGQQIDDDEYKLMLLEPGLVPPQSQDHTQQQDLEQPIEPESGSNKVNKTQDLIQQNINQNQQGEEVNTEHNLSQQTDDQGQQKLGDVEQQSQVLIDQLRNKVDRDQLHLHYQPRPVYGYHDGIRYEVGTTRQLSPQQPAYGGYRPQSQAPDSRNLINYASPQEEEVVTETVRDIEPVEPQTAHEVQQVQGIKTKPAPLAPVEPKIPKEPEVEEITTTEQPGWWSRLGSKIKNKAASWKEKIG